MARYNEILVGRLNRYLQKFLNIKGDAPAPQLSSDWQATIDFASGMEMRYLQGWDRFSQQITQAGAAGFQSGIRFRNPAGSNVIAIFEKMFNANTTLQTIDCSRGAPQVTDLATVFAYGPTTRDDARARPNPTLILSSQATTAVVPALVNASTWLEMMVLGNSNTDVILFENEERVLMPGDAIQFVGATVNQALTFSFQWRERFLEEGERM